MAAIKFSKQNIQPNPLEVDYWVDITSNPYGGNIKYHNGYDWVDLLNSKGTPINLDAYYNKVLVNQMLAGKASVESVDSKVDDTEVADVIKNIEFKDRGDEGVEMVVLKYNDMTVGVTLPVASNTTSGIITKKSFKDLVKQNQLQLLYSEIYNKVTEIHRQYQKKLKAGNNIKIDETTNTIHATGKISTDWNDLINVPDIDGAIQAETDRAKAEEAKLSARITDHVEVVEGKLDLKADKSDIYTKDQVDEKVASVYKIIGSSTFEELPIEGNKIGDVYNITNDFVLNDVEYPFGTNIVWTADGWDTLSGVFDTTELEGLVEDVDIKVDEEIVRAKAKELELDEKFDGYLPLSGGELSKNYDASVLVIRNDAVSPYIGFKYGTNFVGAILSKSSDGELYYGTNYKDWKKVLHEGNYSNYVLPLSGGTLQGTGNIVLRIYTSSEDKSVIGFKNGSTSNSVYFGITSDATFKISSPGATSWYKVWHEGNDGEGSGLDADTLDGYHKNQFQKALYDYIISDNTAPDNTLLPNILSYGSWSTGAFGFVDTKFYNRLEADANRTQLVYGYSSDFIKFRRHHDKQWSDWKTIAFTDSNITGNAATATKLATPVKLWGNYFDGSSDVNGYLIMQNNYPLMWKGIDGSNVNCILLQENNNLFLGAGIREKGTRTIIGGGSIEFTTTQGTAAMFITKSDNVGIGTTDPLYKLDVNGVINAKTVIVGNNTGYYLKDNKGDNVRTLCITTENALLLGHDTASLNYATVIDGSMIALRSNTTHSNALIVNPFGNVTIGSSDLATDRYKLHVAGKVYLNEYGAMGNKPGPYLHINKSGNPFAIGTSSRGTDSISFGYASDNSWINETITISNTGDCVGINNNNPECALDVNGVSKCSTLQASYIDAYSQITSGDLVDWYGVSWSEDSSDPTCTRIGNMALHRSLPILNAMTRCLINNDFNTTSAEGASGLDIFNEMILPIDNNGTVVYTTTNNNTAHIFTDSAAHGGNVFVKIPEFWYIDEYEYNTKTHNLKISQTAKAGWCHHKEAYVGAYEGYNDGIYYRSIKNVIPTVSVSRTTLRPLARANGYEDEYKWNIYTYEEHRAICHLFLVEYATRNSQLAVNTALTADGFKQGGLGSGCTTGIATINGQTVYSFIPTGTTDSLGNGSGQVAYTVTQTDADGNEIGTVTRYANRYRGIENPFGHIWKHVDDIVNVYNAETTYKTVYKCNKPEHFATNKNAKYKPLCSFPGGSKMQDWSKEIKATINCDFFKYSVRGGESTYWCDYNYDNDDTSEHCLLIGGRSGHGGLAGLFLFGLHNGVGYSYVYIGSRLTYLPWAE